MGNITSKLQPCRFFSCENALPINNSNTVSLGKRNKVLWKTRREENEDLQSSRGRRRRTVPVADGTRRALLITPLGRFLAFWALPQDAEVLPHSSPGHAPGHARLPHGAQLDPQRDGKSHTRELSADKNQEVIQNWCPSALGNRKTEQLRDNDDLSENKPCVPRVERPRPADDTARGSGPF